MITIQELKDNFINKFKEALCEQIVNPIIANELRNFKSLTEFYKNNLFPKIAKKIDLKCSEKEFLRIDILLTKEGKHGYHVPMVAVESENIAEGTSSDLDKEIRKLLSINAPIKVLLTRFKDFEKEINSVFEGHPNSIWYYSMADFYEHSRLNGFFIIINAHWSETNLTYSILTYDDKMNITKSLETINFDLDLLADKESL
jgi:hypothetical protein